MNIQPEELLKIFLYIAVPMVSVQILYRLIDFKGSITRFFTKRLTYLKNHKAVTQILSAVVFIALFGGICSVFDINIKIYYIVCGAYLGFLNGRSATIMNDD